MVSCGAGPLRFRVLHQASITLLVGKAIYRANRSQKLGIFANSMAPKLVKWRIILSEFKYLIEHIPGTSNVVVDGLTRVDPLELNRRE